MDGVDHDDAIKNLFKGKKAIDLASKNLKSVEATSLGSSVAKVLIDNKISSCPVVENGKPIAFVDVLDLSTFVMSCITMKVHDPSHPEKKKYKFDEKKWEKCTARDLANCSHRNPFVTVKDTACVVDVIKALISTGAGHRALLVDDNMEMKGVISQGDIVKLFFQSVDKFPIAKKTIKELRIGYCEVTRILTTDSAYMAFERLSRRNISGLAVVNDDGHTLYGNLSGSDIKHLGEHPGKTWKLLKQPVQDFISDHAKQESVLYVLASETISNVAKKFSELRVHRLFIADHVDRMNLIGVISLSDVIRLLHNTISVKKLAAEKAGKHESSSGGSKHEKKVVDSTKKEESTTEKDQGSTTKKDEKRKSEAPKK